MAGEVEHVFVAVVDEAGAVDGLVVADGQVAIQGGAAGGVAIDGDRLDPVDGVLESEDPARHPGHVEAGPGIGWLRADVKEERAVGREHAGDRRQPASRPAQVGLPGQRVVVRPVADAEVVGRRGDDDVDRVRFEPRQEIEAIAVEECASRGAAGDGAKGGGQRREAPHARKDSAPRRPAVPARALGRARFERRRESARRRGDRDRVVAAMEVGRAESDPSPPRRRLHDWRGRPDSGRRRSRNRVWRIRGGERRSYHYLAVGLSTAGAMSQQIAALRPGLQPMFRHDATSDPSACSQHGGQSAAS